jgi:lipopolysaccharide export LptBFGC system permease protein LptF
VNLPLVSARPRRLSLVPRLRPWTIDLYVARLFLAAYVVCLISFTGIYVLVEAFAKLDRFLRQDTALLSSLIQYHAAMIPTAYANFMGPLLTVAAGMFTMTHLQKHNELTPLKAAGASIYRVMVPIFVLAGLLTVATFFMKDRLLPRFREPIRAALQLARAKPLNPPPYYDQDRGFLIRVREYSTTRKVAKGIEISELHPNGKVKEQIDATHMEWVPAAPAGGHGPEVGSWVLHEGSIQRWDENGHLIVNAAASKFERLKAPFKRLDLETSMLPIDLESSDVEISYLSWHDLKTQYQRQPYHRHLAVKLHHHFAFPLSHIVLLLLGLPFVLGLGTKSGFLSIAVSFGICALFFVVSSICMSVANHPSEILSPILAAWLPVMLFGSIGITFFERLAT